MKTSNNEQYFDYPYLKLLSEESIKLLNQQNLPCEVSYEDFVVYMNDYIKQSNSGAQLQPGQFNFFIRTTYDTLKTTGLLTDKADWKAVVALLMTCELETINNIEFNYSNYGGTTNDKKN